MPKPTQPTSSAKFTFMARQATDIDMAGFALPFASPYPRQTAIHLRRNTHIYSTLNKSPEWRTSSHIINRQRWRTLSQQHTHTHSSFGSKHKPMGHYKSYPYGQSPLFCFIPLPIHIYVYIILSVCSPFNIVSTKDLAQLSEKDVINEIGHEHHLFGSATTMFPIQVGWHWIYAYANIYK